MVYNEHLIAPRKKPSSHGQLNVHRFHWFQILPKINRQNHWNHSWKSDDPMNDILNYQN